MICVWERQKASLGGVKVGPKRRQPCATNQSWPSVPSAAILQLRFSPQILPQHSLIGSASSQGEELLSCLHPQGSTDTSNRALVDMLETREVNRLAGGGGGDARGEWAGRQTDSFSLNQGRDRSKKWKEKGKWKKTSGQSCSDRGKSGLYMSRSV